MPHYLTATLKDGTVLTREFADEQTAQAELRMIDRLLRARWGLPEIFWPDMSGQKWCLGIYDFAELPRLLEGVPAA